MSGDLHETMPAPVTPAVGAPPAVAATPVVVAPPATPPLSCDLFTAAASWRPAAPLHVVGFDSAWTLGNTGALAAISATQDGLELVVPPGLCTFARARDLILELRKTGPVLLAIDQPLVVPNASSCRPVDRVAGSLVNRRKGGVQPANTSKTSMFGVDAPIWKFLREVSPTSIDPRARPDGPTDLWALEVFPALASVGLFPQVQADKLLKYNPAVKRSFKIGDWLALTRVLSAIAADLRVPALAAWAERLALARPTKALQDEIDAVLCVLIGLLIQFAPSSTAVLGDALAGYIVTPCPPPLHTEMTDAAARAGVLCTLG